jgi:hypothetical protein
MFCTITEPTLKREFYSLILQRMADGQISKEAENPVAMGVNLGTVYSCQIKCAK